MSYHGRHAVRRNPRQADHADRQNAPKSQAWAEAQNAFSAPVRPAPPAEQPRVVMKRSRVGIVAPQVEAQAQPGSRPLSMVEDKAPRVFRVETAPVEASVIATVANEPSAATSAPAVTRRKRRVDADKQPGPVVVAFQAPAPQPEVPADDQGDPGLSKAEVRALTRLLARLDPIFEDIRLAQNFRFIEAP